MGHDSNCGCRILVDSAAARSGIAAADREITAGRDAGRFSERDGDRIWL